ncbi:MAG: long-chain fatty acid--CoA ligase [Thermoanaerobaculia bacterium]
MKTQSTDSPSPESRASSLASSPADILGERARVTPDREALVIVQSDDRLTYAELDWRICRAAAMLTNELGLQRGDRYGILLHNCVEFLDLFFAAAKTGLIAVPLSTRATAHELEGIFRDSGLSALFYGPEFTETIEECRGALSSDASVIPVESSEYAKLICDAEAADVTPAGCDPEDLVCLLYTSGTTGAPKGVMIPHRMLAFNGYNTAVNWSLREDDRSPVFTPMYHAGGIGAFLVPIFTAGGTIVLHRKFDVPEIWRTIERERCTVALGVPTIYRMLMEAPEFATADLSSIRWLISGGAPLPLTIIEAYQKRGVVFKQGFGMTEVGVNCFSMTVEDSFRKRGSIGRPMLHTRARVVDEGGNDMAPNEVGELVFKGPHVSKGYWNDDAATAASWDRDGWFHSGDLARIDEEGFFYIAGRKKDMLISGGVNVYPAEIEAELVALAGVADAAVVGVRDEEWGEVGVAFVVPVAGATLDPETLSAQLQTRLAKHKLPKRYHFIDALPRTPYGKVLKADLRKLAESPGVPREEQE